MDITITAKNAEVSEDLEEYVHLKIGKLRRYSNRIQLASVTFAKGASKNPSRSHRVEVVLKVPGPDLRSVEESENFFIGLDCVLDKLKRQVRRYKTKREDKFREPPRRTVTITREVEEAAEEVAEELQTERYSIKPLSIDEARMQLDLSDRDFFLFVDHDGQVKCVHQLEDGSYGLMIPEVEV